jgi:hypothetical protein
MTLVNCSTVSRVAGTAVPMPALLTSTSTRPNSAIVGVHQALAVLGLGDVGGHRDRATAEALDHRLGFLEALDAAGAEGDVRARFRECAGKGDAEAGRRAGDDRDATVEAEQV